MDFDILLGPVINAAHMNKLEQVAAWLDANKFPCTLAVYEGAAHLTVSPNPDGPKDWNWDVFRFYVLDTVICALSAHLVEAT